MNASVLSSHSVPSLNGKVPGIIELDGSQYSALRMELEVQRRVRQAASGLRTQDSRLRTLHPGPARSAEDTTYEQLKREAAALVQKMIAAGAVKVLPETVQAQALRDERAEYERNRRRVMLKCGLTTQGKPRRRPSPHTNGGVKLTTDRNEYMRAYRRKKFLAAGLTTDGQPRQRATKHGGNYSMTPAAINERLRRQPYQA